MKGKIQKSRYSQWENALKNDTGEKYRHDGLDRYRVWKKNDCTESNKFRNETTIDRKINFFKAMRFSRRIQSMKKRNIERKEKEKKNAR